MASEEVVDVEVARKKMREWREKGFRNSDEVVDLGKGQRQRRTSIPTFVTQNGGRWGFEQ